MKTNRMWIVGSAAHKRHSYSNKVPRKGPKVALTKTVMRKSVRGYKPCLTGGEL